MKVSSGREAVRGTHLAAAQIYPLLNCQAA